MSVRVFVDETKAKGYLVAAATGLQPQLATPRKELNTLVLPGQRCLHMKDERDSRRREIADAIVRMKDGFGIEATIYDAGRTGPTEKDRRARCLKAIVNDAARHREQTQIIFDRDESLVSFDRQKMIEYTRAAGAKDRITYDHSTRQTELLLAIPDAIAWCWARGGQWRRRVEPIVVDVRTL